ncbi:pyruvate, phosphate dikinase [Candidatus Nitrosotenuis uzonensis]|uniref:pyruvate, phosphate dikinase n=1 Tax=Candidatus Nitrosotenuis uzonensis TaxID=1407055 RepID=A0A812F5X7_9ARCH|nr:pyruvate, phosphate dikinase [Candidatus Nitrosotenuis uzonensis]MCA2003941.1 pyruvate, phosphate dikinase [Candidatus Nitrosotenuis sp.]CAE6498462.1 Pyruvate, phosphate dikinase [Candidatus Nitrosotenuis uzonensis]
MKMVYSFDEGDGKNRKLLGGKGAGLCEMTQLKLPVPPGFTITTEVCKAYYQNNKNLPKTLWPEVKKNIAKLERKTGKKWNSKENPLLVSVRSGAAISMPGMMDTILNLGLNDTTVEALTKKTSNPRFAWDSYRRFVQLFGKVVFGVNDKKFDAILENAKNKQGVHLDSDLNEQSLREVVSQYKDICQKHTGQPFPSNPDDQLLLAIKAVFNSWMGERAVVYREKNHVTKDIADGTAVNVVAMVFGNMGNDSATGVVFTRNPGDGTNKIFGEYLVNAQGEDVVAGVRTPKPVDEMKNEMPKSYELLLKTCRNLERHYKEPQDIEFTVERGKFYLLQTRSAKMNAAGMIKTSVDMVKEKLITKERALLRLQADQLEQLLHKTIDYEKAKGSKKAAKGIAASPGAASGIAVFDVKQAVAMGENGAKVILVREETKPEDVPAFFASVGILTSRGGKTSHAAVVARGMGKPCIVGCSELKINQDAKMATVGDITIRQGDQITIDGSQGDVYLGDIPTIEPQITDNFKTILEWAKKAKKIGIRANADTPDAAQLARRYGAEGIGLCRTERMFNASDRLGLFVKLIMAKSVDERKQHLEKLQELQKSDFIQILKAMEGYKVTIRLLDPPLHEFLPNPEELINKIHKLEKQGNTQEIEELKVILARAKELAEINPMMGHRGVRVGITYPEIYEMQIRAVFEAGAELAKQKINAYPQIMIPQVGSITELNHIRQIYEKVKAEVESKYGLKLKINFGTMLEVVRACLTSGELASTAEFFSFGTNDLTQAVFSYSREDVEGKFLPEYMEKEILERNPFQTVDVNGVGSLVKIAISNGRALKPGLEIGVCGEHGGDPNSIKFFHGAGVSYVSASPHRIPIAIVAAAQAAILNKSKPKAKAKKSHK